jgi:hypothetical protein
MSEQYPHPEQLHVGMVIRLGLHIPNFSYGTPVAELFPAVKAKPRKPRPPDSTPSW